MYLFNEHSVNSPFCVPVTIFKVLGTLVNKTDTNSSLEELTFVWRRQMTLLVIITCVLKMMNCKEKIVGVDKTGNTEVCGLLNSGVLLLRRW